jgi:hypothetical protein
MMVVGLHRVVRFECCCLTGVGATAGVAGPDIRID